MQEKPFRVNELLNLNSIGVERKFMKFGVATMESERYVAVRDRTAEGDEQLVVVEMQNNFAVIRTKNNSEGAIMHPSANIMALRKTESDSSTVILQIWDLEKKEKLKIVVFSERIVFWKWLNRNKLGVITTTSVYHVNIANQSEDKVKICDRTSALVDPTQQIVGYALEPNERWCALSSIATPDGGKSIVGNVQLALIETGKTQSLEGFAPCFGEVMIHGEALKSLIFVFCERKANESTSRIHMVEISAPPEGAMKFKKLVEIPFTLEFPMDFPIATHISTIYDIVYVVMKSGFVYVYKITTASLIFCSRVAKDNIFVVARSSNDGIVMLSVGGQVLSFEVDEPNFTLHTLNNYRNISNDFCITESNKLPGVDATSLEAFNRCIIAGDYLEAVRIAIKSPGTLRNNETIMRFKQLQSEPGQPLPLLIYFSTLLEKGKLNRSESIYLCELLIAKDKKYFIEKWIVQDKLEWSEELDDLLKRYDPDLALTFSRQDESQQRVSRLSNAAEQEYLAAIKSSILSNPEGALELAKSIVGENPGLNVHQIAEAFLSANRIKEFTNFLLDCMRENKSEDEPMQTKAIEVNLMFAPQVVIKIFELEIWTQFNKAKIAKLCEQNGLLERALEFATDLSDIRRIILNTHVLDPEWLTGYLSKLPPEWMLACLSDLLRHDRTNERLVLNVIALQHLKLT